MYYLFDLDGTIIDSNGVWIDVDIAFLARRGVSYTQEYANGVAHTIFPLAAKFTKAYCNIDDSEESIMAEWMELAGDRYSKSVELKPFTADFLKKCHEAGIRMSLLSSCVPEHGRAVLERHGLTHYFEHLIFAHDLKIEKSDLRIYDEVEKITGVAKNECVLFDDSSRSCRGAKAAGLKTVGVYDKMFSAEADTLRSECDRYIMSFEELLNSPVVFY